MVRSARSSAVARGTRRSIGCSPRRCGRSARRRAACRCCPRSAGSTRARSGPGRRLVAGGGRPSRVAAAVLEEGRRLGPPTARPPPEVRRDALPRRGRRRRPPRRARSGLADPNRQVPTWVCRHDPPEDVSGRSSRSTSTAVAPSIPGSQARDHHGGRIRECHEHALPRSDARRAEFEGHARIRPARSRYVSRTVARRDRRGVRRRLLRGEPRAGTISARRRRGSTLAIDDQMRVPPVGLGAVDPGGSAHRPDRIPAADETDRLRWSRGLMFSRSVLDISPAEVAERAQAHIREEVLGDLRRRGAVVAMSGGIDSSVVAALCARALGPERVARAVMPERDSSERRAAPRPLLAEQLGIEHVVEDIAPRSTALGCYERQPRRSGRSFPSTATAGAASSCCRRSSTASGSTSSQLTVAEPGRRRAHVAHAARRVPADRRRHQLQAADPQDDRVLPRRPAELRRRRHAEPARVRPGLLREAGRRRRRLQADRAPLQDPGLRAGRVPGRARGDPARPPTTDTFSLPQTQEEFYFALPYEQMDLCLWAHDHGVPAGEVGGRRSGSRASRSSGSTATSRPSAGRRRYCTTPAARRADARGAPEPMCGIAGIVAPGDADAAARRAKPRARWSARSRHRGPDEFGIYRDRRAGARARPAVDHRPRDRPAADVQRGRHALARVQRRDLQLRRAARRAGRAGHRFRTGATPRSSSTPASSGATTPSRASTASSPSPCGTPPTALVLARDRLGVRPLYLCEHGGRLWFASEVKAHLRRRSVDLPRAFDPVGLAQTFTFWTTSRRRRCSRASPSWSPGTSGPSREPA